MPTDKPRPDGKPKVDKGAQRRAAVVAFAHSLVGIAEVPNGSNDGPGVHRIQTATGAYREPWCVSTVQYEDLHAIGSTYAHDTAGVYAYLDFARAAGHLIPKPRAGCAVCYLIGAGHAGRVVSVNADGTFYAVEGNEENAVRIVLRNPRVLACRFVLRPEYR